MATDPRDQLAVFLRDVKDHLEDNTPRFVLADWLQDQGDPRGELLAVNLLRDGLAEDDPGYKQLHQRERSLLRQHIFDWLGGLIDVVSDWRFRRGFLHLEARADRLFANPVETLASPEVLLWVESLRLTAVSRHGVLLLGRSRILDTIASLDLSGNELDDATLIELLRSDRLADVRGLNLASNRIGARGIEALVRCPHLGRLQALDLRGNRLTVEAMALLRERFGDRLRLGRLPAA